MSVGAWGRTWEDASTPSAARLTRRYEQAWREADTNGSRPDPRAFLAGWPEPGGFPGARLAVLRTDMSLRWESGQRASAEWYAERYPELGEDTIVALIYEEFCLLEEAGESPDAAAFMARYEGYSGPLQRVLDIHRLVGAGSASAGSRGSTASTTHGDDPEGPPKFPEAGDAIAGFQLVEELGRGSFGRVFLARETQLADRPVALKVSLRGSREPQTLARLQHTHIVPVHSHRVDPATGLHVLCMPYFGRVTLSRLLNALDRADGETPLDGHSLVEALDRLEPEAESSGPSASRAELTARTFPRALAWWGARLAEALGHAHERGVLHRDVKPSNVLIASDGTPMLLDFNLAHEAIAPDGGPGAAASLGGTVDYMAPEHLEALAEAVGDHVDARSDVFSMGVLLYEALLSAKPFAPPRRTASVVEALLDAADERRRDLGVLFAADVEIPTPFRAVLERCLAPEPEDRYQSAEELAVDLQAVADDYPLVHAREPLWSRVGRRIRRNRLRFATAALVFVSCAAAGAAAINLSIERTDRAAQADRRLEAGDELMQKRDFETAKLQYDAAVQFAEGPSQSFLKRVFDPRNVRDLADRLRIRLTEPHANGDLERRAEDAKQKYNLAEQSALKRQQAQAVHAEAEDLRMRFVGVAEGRAPAAERLQDLLAPFYVLGPKDWTKHDHNLSMLAPDELARLKSEVNELLFLWMVGVDASLLNAAPGSEAASRETISLAIDHCDRALRFVDPPGPWRELRRRFEERLSGRSNASASSSEPLPENERSALACFQWGLLHSSRGELAPAIEWLQQAVRINWSNYWYQYYLGYLEDQAGRTAEALRHYDVAKGMKADSPWVLFSRARLCHTGGQWTEAVEDLEKSLALMGDRPEASRVLLELGYVHQRVGDVARARRRYSEVVLQAERRPDDPLSRTLGRAARLNIANLDAEAGDVARAQEAFGELLTEDPSDVAARRSRALLDLRLGHPDSAEAALEILVDREDRDGERSDLLAARAIVRMMLGRRREAVADAFEARRLDPTPARDRLVERALLAAGRYDELQIDRPENLTLFPVGGVRLRADLLAAERRIADTAAARPDVAHRLRLTRAVILSALGRHREAARAVGEALTDSNQNSAGAHLIAARVAHRAGDDREASRLVELGLKREPNDSGLLELRGVLKLQGPQPRTALVDLDLAVSRSDDVAARIHRARALHRLGRTQESAREWNVVIRRDPERPDAYLGQALCFLEFSPPLIEPALADLEQAAAWSNGDPAIEFGLLIAYARCLPARPDRLPRWLELARRATFHSLVRFHSNDSAAVSD